MSVGRSDVTDGAKLQTLARSEPVSALTLSHTYSTLPLPANPVSLCDGGGERAGGKHVAAAWGLPVTLTDLLCHHVLVLRCVGSLCFF